jgi:CheY-like chemotaxis protein
VSDDQQNVTEALKSLLRLEYNDAEILTFTDAEEAWQELTRKDPDLFTTDWTHPKIRCGETLRLLAARKVKYPIFVITAYAEWLKENDFPREFLDQGLNVTLLSKPFTVEQLRSLLSKHLGPGENSKWQGVEATP